MQQKSPQGCAESFSSTQTLIFIFRCSCRSLQNNNISARGHPKYVHSVLMTITYRYGTSSELLIQKISPIGCGSVFFGPHWGTAAHT